MVEEVTSRVKHCLSGTIHKGCRGSIGGLNPEGLLVTPTAGLHDPRQLGVHLCRVDGGLGGPAHAHVGGHGAARVTVLLVNILQGDSAQIWESPTQEPE